MEYNVGSNLEVHIAILIITYVSSRPRRAQIKGAIQNGPPQQDLPPVAHLGGSTFPNSGSLNHIPWMSNRLHFYRLVSEFHHYFSRGFIIIQKEPAFLEWWFTSRVYNTISSYIEHIDTSKNIKKLITSKD